MRTTSTSTATEANTPNTRARTGNHHNSFEHANSIGRKQIESRDKKVIHAINATGYAISQSAWQEEKNQKLRSRTTR